MRNNGLMRTGMAMLTLASLALTTVAPAADASHRGNGRRWKSRGSYASDYGYGRGGYRTRVIEVRRSSSCAGPTIAGFIGGVALGAALSSRPSQGYDRYDYGYARDEYDYYDPYCGRRYDTLDACSAHYGSCGHRRVVTVISEETGDCVDNYRYGNGRWSHYDGGSDGRYADWNGGRHRDRDDD